MQGKTRSSVIGKKGKARRDTLDSSRLSLVGASDGGVLPETFAVDYPHLCAEFEAKVIPEVMIKDNSGKFVPARPMSKDRSRESEDRERRPRKSRLLSTSPGRVSVTSQSAALEHAAAAAALGGPESRSCTFLADGEGDASALNYVIVTFEDDKRSDTVKGVTFKGFAVEDAHIKALGKGLPGYPTLSSITFKQSKLSDHHVPLLTEALAHGEENLVEISIEECPIPEQNYYLILRECKRLEILFLRGCKIDSTGAKLIAEELSFKEDNATSSLLYLNLSKNMIDDEGASALAKALRTNRTLVCLALSGNTIGDDGALSLADCLAKFQLTDKEIMQRRIAIKQRIKVFQKMMEEAMSKHTIDNHVGRPNAAEKGRTGRQSAMKSDDPSKKLGPKITSNGMSDLWKNVDEEGGLLKNPLLQEVWPEGGKLLCAGNLHLAHLNLGFNKINVLGAQRFLQTLCYQINFKSSLGQNNSPTGLVNLVLHGNPIPVTWSEWDQMYEMLSQISGKPIAQKYSESSVENPEKTRTSRVNSK